MLTRYGVEFKRGELTITFIVVVNSSETLQIVQTAMENDGWELKAWTPIA